MRIIFMGSPDFAIPTLEALLESVHDVVCVYTQPPRSAGRGKKLRPTQVHVMAEEAGVEVRYPARLKNEALDELFATDCDVIVVVAYGLLLPLAILNYKICLNIHPSSLPRWRGPAPLQHTVMAGDKTTEICVMQLDEGMYTGPVDKRLAVEVGENETVGHLYDRAAMLGADVLMDVLDELGMLKPVIQSEEGVIIAPKITSDMRPVDWGKSAQEVHNHIRGMSSFPSATCKHGDEVLKLLESRIVGGNGKVGEVISVTKEGITVACGEGAVSLKALQRAGKKAMGVEDFIKGYSILVGEILN